MIHRPTLTPFWKGITFVLIIAFIIGGFLFALQIFYQKEEQNDLRKTKAFGILVEKKDLNRGDFLLVIVESNKKKELIISGFDLFYDKFHVGDSLIKKIDSFQFDIYRKDTNQNYQYLYTLGYD